MVFTCPLAHPAVAMRAAALRLLEVVTPALRPLEDLYPLVPAEGHFGYIWDPPYFEDNYAD